MVTTNRKLVNFSTTAAVTPGRVLTGFVRAGYVRDAVDAHETEVQRSARVKAAENQASPETKLKRTLIRHARRDARAAQAQECQFFEERVHMSRICNALDKMTADLRSRGCFERYETGAPEPPSEDNRDPEAGDCYLEESSDSAIDVPMGIATTKAGRKSLRQRFDDAMKESRDFALWRTLNVENNAYFDRQDEQAYMLIFVKEEECALPAHRGRKRRGGELGDFLASSGGDPAEPAAKCEVP